MQFVDTARELEIYTIKQCLKFPKRHTFFITTEIVQLSRNVYNYVKSANSIYVTKASDAQMREEFLIKANCDLQCLISQLDIAKELFGATIDSKVWMRWMEYISEEAKLISAVRKRDKERHIFS